MAEPLGAVDLSKLPPSNPVICVDDPVWQEYVDKSLMASKHFDKAGILKADWSGLEAKSTDFQFTKDNLTSLMNAFRDSNGAFHNGFSLGQDKYFTIKADECRLYGKKGKEGVIVFRTNICTFIAHHTEDVQTTNAANVVEKVANYVNGGAS